MWPLTRLLLGPRTRIHFKSTHPAADLDSDSSFIRRPSTCKALDWMDRYNLPKLENSSVSEAFSE